MDEVLFEDVSFTYAGGSKPAIEHLNLKIGKGEIVLIAGPNAAGKTTLCRCLNGLVPHFFIGDLHGNVVIQSRNTRDEDIGRLSQIVGLVFDDPVSQLVCSSVSDEIAFGPENLGIPRQEIVARVAESIEFLRLKGYERRRPQFLSGGEQQAVAIGAVMAMRPSIYALDEPTSNLDPIGSEQVIAVVKDLMKKENKTLIIVSHNLEDLATVADRIIVLNEGKIILDGTPRQVFESVDILEKIGLAPPQVTRLMGRLRGNSKIASRLDRLPLTVEEACEILARILRDSRYSPKQVGRHVARHEINKEQEVIVEAENVTFFYPKTETPALKDINVKVYHGEFVAIIGQNGSGKTTLVKHFNGLLRPTKGTVRVKGEDAADIPTWRLSERVGYVFQNPDLQLFNTSVRNEIAFGPKSLKYPKEKIDAIVADTASRLKIDHLLNESPGTLDKGGRQRTAIAAVLALNPDVVVVDEPTTGQDPAMSRQIMNTAKQLNESGKTIITITHNMELASEYARRVIVMWNGEILIDGPVREVFRNSQALRQSYLRAPQVTRLAQALQGEGFSIDALSVEEMFEQVEQGIS